jgi:hypothetical protein
MNEVVSWRPVRDTNDKWDKFHIQQQTTPILAAPFSSKLRPF